MAELISRTGRVQSWIDDPDGRLPVQLALGVSIQLLTKLSEEAESTRMEP